MGKSLETPPKKSEKDIVSHKAMIKAKAEAIVGAKNGDKKVSDEKVEKTDKKSVKSLS